LTVGMTYAVYFHLVLDLESFAHVRSYCYKKFTFSNIVVCFITKTSFSTL